MEKVVKAFLLTLVVLGLTGVASADYTVDVYSTVNTSPPFATNYTWGSGGVGWHYPIQWQHTWTIPDDSEFVMAKLVVTAQYAGQTERTYLENESGPLLGDLVTGTVSFDLSAYESYLDGDLTVYARLFDEYPQYGRYSRLSTTSVRNRVRVRVRSRSFRLPARSFWAALAPAWSAGCADAARCKQLVFGNGTGC
jgi:hypothetical protein